MPLLKKAIEHKQEEIERIMAHEMEEERLLWRPPPSHAAAAAAARRRRRKRGMSDAVRRCIARGGGTPEKCDRSSAIEAGDFPNVPISAAWDQIFPRGHTYLPR